MIIVFCVEVAYLAKNGVVVHVQRYVKCDIFIIYIKICNNSIQLRAVFFIKRKPVKCYRADR